MTDAKDMSKEIVSSTGSMGIDTRSDNRIYWNVRQPMENALRVERSFNRLEEVKRVNAPDVRSDGRRQEQFNFGDLPNRRDVMRFIASDEAARQLINPRNPFSSNVEVAFPIDDNDWYISLGRNGVERKTADSLDNLVHDTAAPDMLKYPIDAVDKVLKEGYSFKTDLSEPSVRDQVLKLWEHTFGWTEQEIENLQKRLEEQGETGEKNVWFGALQRPTPDGRKIVAVGMAEKIQFKRTNGKHIDIIELTEWSVDPDFRGNGYMPATVTQIAAQVLNSYQPEERKEKLLIAEVNIQNRAHRTGYSSGMNIAERVAPQILKQNVAVDGVKSDFALMYISPASLARNYSPDTVQAILRETQAN